MSFFQRPTSVYMSTPLLLILCLLPFVLPQSISTTLPVPPLQWINLTGLLGGPNAPPPLKDASLGYNDGTRTLLVFGGESQQGFPQAQTYLLNLDTLTWQVPSPPVSLDGGPPPRSAALGGDDVAASNRHSHLVIGGKGTNGQALSDVWAFDYTSQFWSQVHLTPGGPSPRWGAVGGIDIRTQPVPDISLPGPNNTFYLAGGFDGKKSVPLSDLWRLNVSGILSSNNPNDVVASWEKLTVPDQLPGKVGLSGAVVLQGSRQNVIALGGCTTSSSANTSCMDGDDYIININARTINSLPSCPAPRLRPAVAPNFKGGSSSFTSQVFMLLGSFNSSLWDDDNGLQEGEVAILDINTGSWARILPSGDPGSSPGGKPSFPSPRAGAAALSWGQALVGLNSALVSDTIVFGGQDESGNYLSELWILRAYNGTLSETGAHWSGYGDGALRGGVNADGQGVTIEYLTHCVSAINRPSSSGTTTGPIPTRTGLPSPSPPPSDLQYGLDTSIVHKTLSSVSVAILLPAVLCFRLSSPTARTPVLTEHKAALFHLSTIIALAAFGIGIGGLASAFTTITTSALVRRSSVSLSTTHGRAGLALFAGLFGLVLVLLVTTLYSWRTTQNRKFPPNGRSRTNSGDLAEKLGLFPGRVTTPPNGVSEEPAPEEVPTRARSWSAVGPWFTRNVGARRSSESGFDVGSSPSTVRSFEVTNRPNRARHASANSLAMISDPRTSGPTRNLGEMGWLERRRSLNAAGDSDFALSQLPRRDGIPPTPGTAAIDIHSTRGLVDPITRVQSPQMPGLVAIVMHMLLHAFLLGLCILTLIALWVRAPKAVFAVFLAWVAGFYAFIVYLASRGIPQTSVLSVVINRVTTDPSVVPPTPSPSRPLSSIGLDSVPFPSGPYSHHQPPFRLAHDSDYPMSTYGHGSIQDDDDIDEDTRQRNIEEEMNRRDVSIVTVPKRKLFLTNPEIP